MHQHPHQHSRPAPSSASPANSEQTNPMRTNNSRDGGPSVQASGSSEDFVPDNSASMQRLNQVIQNFHTKAALIILHSRTDLSPAYSAKTNERRVNKWFNIEMDETDDYLDDIKRWKRIDIPHERPPPLIIEVYLSTDPLPQGQRLVVLDDDQKRWDVYKAVDPRDDRSASRPQRSREILLERWTIALGEPRQPLPADLAAILPHVYKKSIVLFRALFTYCNFLPAWKLIRKLGKSRSTMGMKVGYRIVDGDRLDSIPRADNLSTPLYGKSSDVNTDYSFGSTESPAGPFSVQVKYRSNCDFRVDDSEELLSSRFIGADDDMFKSRDDRGQRVGSLPNDQRRHLLERPELGQAYGSLSTFHQAGIELGTSPMSALRAQKDYGTGSASPQRPLPQQAPPDRPSASRTSTGRRTSFSINPFKAPTLAASPLASSPLSASPRPSARALPTLGSLREEAPTHPVGAPSTRKSLEPASSPTGSPKPAPVQRFQSSFGHRKNKLSVDRTTATTTTTNKTEDDQTSSGKGSAASSAQPGSGLIGAPPSDGSAGSLQDDENIEGFLKMLDQKKDLLRPTSNAQLESSARRTAVALNTFHRMRDSNAALSESMTSSLVAQKSSTASSRQLPGLAAASTSTSPGGKPVSPHAPHQPFAPSRLSAAYSHDDPTLKASPEDERHGFLPHPETQGAIDIPNSPRPFDPSNRRSSSAQRQPLSSDDDIADLYGMRSASLDTRLRREPPLPENPRPSDLQRREVAPEAHSAAAGDGTISESGSARSSLPNIYRQRFSRPGAPGRGGSHPSPTQGSLSSFGGTGASVDKEGDSGSASGSWGRSKRIAPLTKPEEKTVGDDEEELPFVFDTSTFISGQGKSKKDIA